MSARRSTLVSVALCLGAVCSDADAALAQTPVEAPAQRARVAGLVIDEATSKPIPGVTVRLVGTSFAAITGADGRYIIPNVTAGVFNIEARRIGYAVGRRENIEVGRDGIVSLNFTLHDNPLRLENVVVSGTVDPTSGTKTPFTVATLTAEDLPVPPNMSAAGAIQGKVAGAKIIRAGGPGAGVNIQLRTPTSQFKSTSPIFVVDGVLLGSTVVGTTTDIESIDIASIEVINGAAAATLYGSLGANGVISITTNRGRNLALNTVQFTARTEYGYNEFTRMLARPTHHRFRVNSNGGYVNAAGRDTTRRGRVVDPVGFMDKPFIDPLYNQAADFYKAGRFQTQNLSLSQNTAATNFTISYNRYGEAGVVEANTGYLRQNLRVNLDFRRGDRFQLGVGAYHQRAEQDNVSVSFGDFNGIDPDVNINVRGPDGRYVVLPDSNSSIVNPLYRETAYEDEGTKRVRTLLNTNATLKPFSWLSLDATASYDRSDRRYEDYIPRGILGTDGQTPTLGRYYRETDEVENLIGHVGATYLNKFGQFTPRFTVRAQSQREINPYTASTATDFSVAGVRDLDVGQTRTVSSSFTDRRLNSVLGNSALDYAGKYIGDFTVRREGNSLYGADSRWNNFYRASAAYLVNEEPWWPIESLNLFKLRYSYGSAGNRPGFSDQYETLGLAAGGLPTRQTFGNARLLPEVAHEHEYGLDMIVRNRVSVSLVYARQRSLQNIVAVPLPALSGFNTQAQNVGDIRGGTYEATVQAQLLNRGGLQWDMNVVADRSRSRIGNFGRSCYVDGILNRCAGANLGEMWGYRFVNNVRQLPANQASAADQFQVNDEGYLVPVGAGNSFRDGVAKSLWGTTVNVNGSAYQWGRPIIQVDSAGRAVYQKIGQSFSDLNFGLGNTIRWKGVQLYGLFTGQLGGDIYNSQRRALYINSDHADMVQAGKPDELKKPYTYYSAGTSGASSGLASSFTYNSAFVEDGTYLKLSEMSLRYTLPTRYLAAFGRAGADRVSLELIGRNMFTITDYKGIDPEAGTPLQRIDASGYPLYRTLTAAVNLVF